MGLKRKGEETRTKFNCHIAATFHAFKETGVAVERLVCTKIIGWSSPAAANNVDRKIKRKY